MSRSLSPAAIPAVAALVSAAIGAAAATGASLPAENAPAQADTALTAPTTQPDRITLNPTTDNETTVAVTWRTAEGVQPQAQISKDTSNPWALDETPADEVTSKTHTTDLGYKQTFHSATFTGLERGTTYLYRVGDGENWSGWMPVTTSDPGASETSLIAMGDIQRGVRETWSRVAASALADRPDARAMMSVGDQINVWNADAEWDELFDAAGTVPQAMQWVPAVGNHEVNYKEPVKTLAEQFPLQFNVPDNGPKDRPEFEDTVYYTDVDDVRIVTLNSYYRIPNDPVENQKWLDEQAAWLETVLKDNPRKFTIINSHYPVYSSSPDRGNPELRETLQPVFEKYGVDLVLQGHDHAYVSGRAMDAETERQRGPIYVTSASAGRQYPLDYQDWTKNGAKVVTAYESRATYQLIDVKGRTMTYTAKDSTGAVTDQWQVRKSAGSHGFKTVKHLGGVGVPKKD